MNPKIIYALLILVILCNARLHAQPYTLDKNKKPVKLALSKHPKYEDAKFAEENFTLTPGKTNYHYVKGHDVFEFVDIFIYAHDGNPSLQAELVLNTWNSIQETQYTSKSKNGIINFKVRSWQDIGFTVKSDESTDVDYGIVVNATEPIMEYLGTPFVKASEGQKQTQDPSALQEAGLPNSSQTSGVSWWIYAIIGILVLLVGFLGGRLMNTRKQLPIILLLALSCMASESYGQDDVAGIRRAAEAEVHNTRRGQIDDMIGGINNAIGTVEAGENFLRQYLTLGSCLRSGPPPGQPKIPTFCVDEEGACAECFARARKLFNDSRYNLEKLQTIYDCTKAYTDAAIAFGDNASGYHGVVGLVWQSKRREIMGSIGNLDRAYDQKRAEMLQFFNQTLEELNICEEEHGLPDWYDRFGVMFYNFVEMRYHR